MYVINNEGILTTLVRGFPGLTGAILYSASRFILCTQFRRGTCRARIVRLVLCPHNRAVTPRHGFLALGFDELTFTHDQASDPSERAADKGEHCAKVSGFHGWTRLEPYARRWESFVYTYRAQSLRSKEANARCFPGSLSHHGLFVPHPVCLVVALATYA